VSHFLSYYYDSVSLPPLFKKVVAPQNRELYKNLDNLIIRHPKTLKLVVSLSFHSSNKSKFFNGCLIQIL